VQATARPAGRQTPDPFRMEKNDVVPQMNSFGSSSSFGTSRGPSPLTIGFSDTIPLALAFSETVHAYFHGGDANRLVIAHYVGMDGQWKCMQSRKPAVWAWLIK
jgi:hypothetical protein